MYSHYQEANKAVNMAWLECFQFCRKKTDLGDYRLSDQVLYTNLSEM